MDFSNAAKSAWMLSDANASAFREGFGGAADAVGDVIKQRKQYKDVLKSGSTILDAAMKLYPETAGALAGVAESLKDEERPLSERATLAGQVGDLINMGVKARNNAFDEKLSLANLAINQQDAGNRNAAAGRDAREFNFTMGAAEESRAINKEAQGMVAPALLEQAIGMARSIEDSGGRAPISSEILQQALQMGTPESNIKLAETFQALLPESKEPVIREIDVTIDGQPSRMPVTWNPGSGKFEPVQVGGQAWGDGSGGQSLPAGDLQASLPSPLKPYAAAYEAAGAKYGVDPRFLAAVSIHETGGGTSPAFRKKNNAMGISNDSGPTSQASVEASIEKMARELAKPDGYYAGKNTIGDIGKTYAPIGARNDPRGLNSGWAKGVGQYYAQLGGNPNGSVRITPGAAKGTATVKTPTEQALDEARLKKLDAEVANKDADLDKQKDAKATAKASAENALMLIEQLRKHPGFKGAVGMSITPGWLPATDRKGAEAIINQLKGQAFLTAIQQLRGLGALSDAEGAKLQQAAVRLDASQSEKDFNTALSDYEQQIKEAMGRLGGATETANPAKSYSERLRAMGQ